MQIVTLGKFTAWDAETEGTGIKVRLPNSRVLEGFHVNVLGENQNESEPET